MPGEVRACCRLRREIVVVVTIETKFLRAVLTHDLHVRVEGRVGVTHDIPLIDAMGATAGVRRRVLDRTQRVRQLMSHRAGIPARTIDPGVAGEVMGLGIWLIGVGPAIEGADTTEDAVVHQHEVLPVQAVEAGVGHLLNETAEALKRTRRGDELGDVDPAVSVGYEAKTERAAGFVRTLVEDAIHLRRQPAEGGQELTQAVRPVVAVDVHELDAGTGHAVVDAKRLRLEPGSARRGSARLDRLGILAVRAIRAIANVDRLRSPQSRAATLPALAAAMASASRGFSSCAACCLPEPSAWLLAGEDLLRFSRPCMAVLARVMFRGASGSPGVMVIRLCQRGSW